MSDPLLPHLLDILASPASKGLILAGGFGIRLKQVFLRKQNTRTLIADLPEARATQDLDFFLKLECFFDIDRGAPLRVALDTLGFEDQNRSLRFAKPLGADFPDQLAILDFLARSPQKDEPVKVERRKNQIPRVGAGSAVGLRGFETPEAFAIEHSPVLIEVEGHRFDGSYAQAFVQTPHPYAWLNVKVAAAHDWLKQERGEIEPKRFREKHVADVYRLVAMLTEKELEQAPAIAAEYQEWETTRQVKTYAMELFGTAESQGMLETRRQIGSPIDIDLFQEILRQALLITD